MKKLSLLACALVLGVATSSAVLPGCVVRGRAAWVVDSQPPPPRETARPAPRLGHVWIEGHWENRGGWVWVNGYWEAQRQNYVWIDGRWEQRGGQWHWVPGRWEVVGSGTTTTVTPDGNTTTGPADPNQPGPRVRTVDTYQDQPGGGGGGTMPPPPR